MHESLRTVSDLVASIHASTESAYATIASIVCRARADLDAACMAIDSLEPAAAVPHLEALKACLSAIESLISLEMHVPDADANLDLAREAAALEQRTGYVDIDDVPF